MSTDRDVTRIVRSWLHEDAHEDADRILDLVLDEIDTTPQRRSGWLARRFPPLNTYARFALVAAAVVLASAVGIGLFARSIGGPPHSSPSPAASVTPSSTPASNPLAGSWLAPEVTCAQEIATIEAAGYTAEQISSAGFDPTCVNGNIGTAVRNTNQYSVVFQGLPTAATIRGATTYDYGAMNSPHHYGLKDATTFELGSHTGKAWEYCLTFHYAINGDQLTIGMSDPGCAETADAPLLDQIALTAILGTSPFTRQP